MKPRLWATVLAVALTLVVVSSARSFILGIAAMIGDLPSSVVVLGMTSCFMLVISVLLLCRTWTVRKCLVLVLTRIGAPNPVIARSVNLPQDGVVFLRSR